MKKTNDGVYLYFAHNTDSFVSSLRIWINTHQTYLQQAVASMSTNDKEPRSVMSRGKGDGHVVNGARTVKFHRYTTPHRGTWPVNPDENRDSDPDPPPPSKRQKTKRERVIKRVEKALAGPEFPGDSMRQEDEKVLTADPALAVVPDTNVASKARQSKAKNGVCNPAPGVAAASFGGGSS